MSLFGRLLPLFGCVGQSLVVLVKVWLSLALFGCLGQKFGCLLSLSLFGCLWLCLVVLVKVWLSFVFVFCLCLCLCLVVLVKVWLSFVFCLCLCLVLSLPLSFIVFVFVFVFDFDKTQHFPVTRQSPNDLPFPAHCSTDFTVFSCTRIGCHSCTCAQFLLVLFCPVCLCTHPGCQFPQRIFRQQHDVDREAASRPEDVVVQEK